MGRHSAASPVHHAVGSSRHVPVRWIAIALALALVGFVAIKMFTDDSTSGAAARTPTATAMCDGALTPVELVVAAPASIAPGLEAIAAQLIDDKVALDGRCIVPTVEDQPSPETASLIAAEASQELPDVWVADSRVWTQRAQTTPVGSARLTGGAQTIAKTPLVLAMSQPAAERTGWPDASPSWAEVAASVVEGDLMIVPDPTVSSAGLGMVMTVATVLGDDTEGRRALVAFVRAAAQHAVADDAAALAGASSEAGTTTDDVTFPTTEQAVIAYNASGPAQRVVAVYPGESQLHLDFSLALVHQGAGGDETAATEANDRLRAALRFQQVVQSESGQEVLADAGFRRADGSTGGAVTTSSGVLPERADVLAVDPGTTAARALGAWRAATLDAQILAVLDVSGSMAEPVGDGRTRLQVASSAAAFAISLFPDTSEFGLWSFSTDLPGGGDHVELVPIGTLADPVGGVARSEAINNALAAVVPTNGTSLYDTTLAAYETAQIAYDPDKISSVVLLTDGENDDDESISLDALIQALSDAADPARPVQIVYVAIGPQVDVPALERIVAAVGGTVYQTNKPEDIDQIYLDAVARQAD